MNLLLTCSSIKSKNAIGDVACNINVSVSKKIISVKNRTVHPWLHFKRILITQSTQKSREGKVRQARRNSVDDSPIDTNSQTNGLFHFSKDAKPLTYSNIQQGLLIITTNLTRLLLTNVLAIHCNCCSFIRVLQPLPDRKHLDISRRCFSCTGFTMI